METQQSYKFLTDLGLAQYDATVRQYMEQTFAKKGETPSGSGVNIFDVTLGYDSEKDDVYIESFETQPEQIWESVNNDGFCLLRATLVRNINGKTELDFTFACYFVLSTYDNDAYYRRMIFTSNIEGQSCHIVLYNGGKKDIGTPKGDAKEADIRLAHWEYDIFPYEAAGGGGGFVNITYAELKALLTASELEVGQKYLISDFAQSYNILDIHHHDIAPSPVIEEQTGVLEPIIVTAISTSKFDKVAISTLYPKDIIHYSFDTLDIRDVGFGNGVDTVNANFKGQIYYREDTVQNVSAHYDFRNVKFRRWAVDATEWTDIGFTANDVIKSAIDGKIYKCILTHTATGIDPSSDAVNWILWLDITADAFVSWTADKTKFNIGGITTTNLIINNTTAGVDYNDFYTFGDYYKWVKDVEIGGINLELMIGELGFSSRLLSQKVFKTTNNPYTCFSMTFGDNNLPMTFGDFNCFMTFGNYNYLMTFGNNNLLMTFGDHNHFMTFGDNNDSMTFGNDNESLTFGDYNRSLTFGNGNYTMTFGNYNRSLTFGNGNSSINDKAWTFGNGNSSMTFGNGNYTMTFGNYNTSMTFGNDNESLTFGDYNRSLTFGNYNRSLTFGDGNVSMTFGDYTNPQNRMITFGDNTTMCVFEAKCFIGLAADLDLSAATHIRGAYNTTIYQDKTNGVKLSYMDAGVMIIADVTD